MPDRIRGVVQPGRSDYRRSFEDGSLPQATEQTRQLLRIVSGMDPDLASQPPDRTALAELATSVLFDAAPDGIVVVDESGFVRLANRRAEDLFGYAREELSGLRVEDLIPETLRSRHVDHRSSYMEKPTERAMGVGLELRGLRKDGSEFPVEISLNTFRHGENPLVIAIVRDLTGHKRLQSFGVQALRAMEVERQRIALELHDETLQELAALLIRLRIAQRGEVGIRVEVWEEIRQHLLLVTEGIRRIAGDLRPPELEALGVASAVRSHARHLTERTGLRTSVLTDDSADMLAPDDQLALYRIIQEAMSNSLKHAPDSQVRVQIAERDGSVVAQVDDDGTGFDVDAAMARRGGLGLISMVERARHAGGQVEIQSAPGEGTIVTARFALPSRVSDD